MIFYGINLRPRTITGTTPEQGGEPEEHPKGYRCPWCEAVITAGLADALTLFERHIDVHLGRGDVLLAGRDAEDVRLDALMAAAVARQTRARLRVPPRVVFRSRIRPQA